MAARLEQERLQARKARLIKQNDLHRENLQAELENLRGAADWMERGFAFYRSASRLKSWIKPPESSRSRSSKNPLGKLVRGCVLGFRLWKNITRG